MFYKKSFEFQKQDSLNLLLIFISIFLLRYFSLGMKPLEGMDSSLLEVTAVKNILFFFMVMFLGNLILVILFLRLFKSSVSSRANAIQMNNRYENSTAIKNKIKAKSPVNEKKDIKELSRSLEAMKDSLKKQNREIYRLAYRDTLTGLLNRKGFYEIFESMLHKKSKNYVLLLLDIDDFKLINDTLGHDTGDTVLKMFSKLLVKSAPKKSLIARLGGDEFVIVFPHPKHNKIQNLIQRMSKDLNEPISILEKEYKLTSSIGVSLTKDLKNCNISDLLKNADMAMYASKEEGKNKATIFTENLRDVLVEEVTQTKELLRAIENNEFYMVYHPLYDTVQEKVWGLESLIRWEHPQNGIIYPSDFISHMEKIGLSFKLAEFVLKEACNTLKTLDPKIKVSINISGELFNSCKFYEMYVEIIEESNIDPKRIILEVTEDSLIYLNDYTIDIFNKIRDLGTEMWIDDFGTGYSSLAYLKELPITGVKIDKSFLKDIETCIQSYNLLDGIIKLATSLNLEVIVEGIETKEEYDILKRLKCTMIQGFYICKPKNYTEMTDFISLLEAEAHIVLSKSALKEGHR